MNIFIDHHHYDITYSLGRLFGRRLGHSVILPIGVDWYERGHWRVFPHLGSVNSHLGLEQADPMVYNKAGVMTLGGLEKPDKRFFYRFDSTKGLYHKCVTFDEFRKMRFDILVASLTSHVPAFNELISRYQPQAKLIFSMSNSFEGYSFEGVKNVLNSTDRKLFSHLHSMQHSHEFDLDLFAFKPPAFSNRIVSFLHYLEKREFLRKTSVLLPDYSFEVYGSGGEGGLIQRTQEVAAKMHQAKFIWHDKNCDDGYGYVVHGAAAVGRPLIISKRHYQKLRFGKFIEDGKTCISFDNCDPEKLSKKIRYYSEPSRYAKMSRSLYENFKKLVNFDQDEIRVRGFLENLV